MSGRERDDDAAEPAAPPAPVEQAVEQAVEQTIEQTKDDTDVGWGETPDPEAARDEHERWLLEQRPPHWD